MRRSEAPTWQSRAHPSHIRPIAPLCRATRPRVSATNGISHPQTPEDGCPYTAKGQFISLMCRSQFLPFKGGGAKRRRVATPLYPPFKGGDLVQCVPKLYFRLYAQDPQLCLCEEPPKAATWQSAYPLRVQSTPQKQRTQTELRFACRQGFLFEIATPVCALVRNDITERLVYENGNFSSDLRTRSKSPTDEGGGSPIGEEGGRESNPANSSSLVGFVVSAAQGKSSVIQSKNLDLASLVRGSQRCSALRR